MLAARTPPPVQAAVGATLLTLLLLSETAPAALAGQPPVQALAGQPPSQALQPGRALYSSACSKLVGAQRIESFSSARASGPNGEQVGGRDLPAGGEAICNCACWPADEFALCRNTAKTTVGVATFAVDESLGRWETRGLRYFRAGSPGARSGRGATSFSADGVLPQGPGGPVVFYSTYVGDSDGSGGRAAEIVKARTSSVACDAAPLCDVQCAGEAQYAEWRARCPAER